MSLKGTLLDVLAQDDVLQLLKELSTQWHGTFSELETTHFFLFFLVHDFSDKQNN